MKTFSRPEWCLLSATLLAAAVAWCGPFVAQQAHYHAFADSRSWLGVPHALDVMSNLPFAVAGGWGLVLVWAQRQRCDLDGCWQLATLFFVGLVVTALGSGYYHWMPSDAGLAWDRIGMVLAFAGLLGLAVADRVTVRAGAAIAVSVLVAGPASVAAWLYTGNLLAWSVVQGGGMLLVLALALRKPTGGAWNLPLWAVIGCYALAKALELGDHAVFALTQGWVSGHTLKHVAAALAAWPVLCVMHNAAGNGASRAHKPGLFRAVARSVPTQKMNTTPLRTAL